MDKITQAALQLKLPEDKLLADWIVCIPGFTLKKYRRLQRSRLSIISLDCFGGIISRSLALPFRSPFVNLRLSDKDFIKFLRRPKIYLDEDPHFEKLTSSSKEAPDGYPLFSLGNISLKMVHYKEANDALTKWNERKTRINRYNLFVTMYTESEEILREFDALPYGKKVCFVPFKSDVVDSAWYIDTNAYEEGKAMDFGRIVRRLAFIRFNYYDVFDMLLYGKKTPLIEM